MTCEIVPRGRMSATRAVERMRDWRSVFETMARGLVVGMVLLGGLATASTGHAAKVGFVTGDSFSNDLGEWPFLMTSASMHSTAIGGQKLSQMAATFGSQLNEHIANLDIDFAMIQGGVNDVASSNFDLNSMQNAIQSMVSVAQSASMPLFIMNIAPWTNATTQAKRDEIDTYNAWLDDNVQNLAETEIIDIYSILVDPGMPQNMNPLYDGDGIHPNALGHQLIAAAADAAVLATVPVPAAVWLFGSALIGLAAYRRGSVG